MQKTVETGRGKFLFRPFKTGDEQGVLSLWRAAFEKEMDPAMWRWKYEDNPYGHQVVICEGEDGRILAMYSGVPYRATWKSETVRLSQLMDIMSHPDYRGEGLFVRAAQFFFDIYGPPEGSVCLYGFPGGYHFKLGAKILNYEALDGGTLFLVGEPEEIRKGRNMFRGRIQRVEQCGPEFDRLASACLKHYPFSVIRDSTFLQWRFLNHPQKSYEIWVYRKYLGKRVQAYAVLGRKDDEIHILDLLAPNSGGILEDFTGRLAAEFKRRGARRIVAWLPPKHFLSSRLLASGFVKTKEPFGFIPTVKILHPELSCQWISENMFYTMADGDLL
jgi:hypothetical protein